MPPLPHSATLAAMRALERTPGGIGSLSSVRTTEPHVVFTFDDGPTADGTPDVMRALAEHAATATFFVLMTKVSVHRELLDELVTEGHEIGLHGVDHRRLSALRPAEIEGGVRRAAERLEDATGRPVRWFRPPYGDQPPAAWRAIRRAGLEPVVWSGTSWDWNPAVDNDTRVATATTRLRPGSVLLFHDGHASATDLAFDGPAPDVDRYDLVSRVLDVCAERDLVGRSLGDALRTGTPITRPHFTLRPHFRPRRPR